MEQQSLLAGHIGAAEGEYDWDITAPGYYRFVGPKGAGKSTLSRVMELLDAPTEDLTLGVPITHGKDEAYFEFTPRRLEIKLSPTGVVLEPVVTGAEVKVERVPSYIQTLVDGDRCVKPETRAEHRLAALLSYAPVEASEAHLDALLGCLWERQATGLPSKGREFDEITAEMQQLWHELTRGAVTAKLLKGYERCRTPAEIRAWILEQPKRVGVLRDHRLLMELLNGMINSGTKAAEEQRRRAAGIEGRLQQAAQDAARQAGVEKLSRHELEAEYDPEELRQALRESETSLGEIQIERAGRVAEERSREGIRGSHGERPEVDATRRDELAAEIELAEKALRDATEESRRHRDRFEKLAEQVSESSSRLMEIWGEWEDLAEEIETAVFGSDPSPENIRWNGSIPADRAEAILARIRRVMEFSPDAEHDEITRTADLAEKNEKEARSKLDRIKEDHAREQERIQQAEREQKTWDEREAKLEAPIEGPTQGEVDAVAEAVATDRAAVQLAEASAGYQAITAEYRAALEQAAEIDLLVKAYRQAKGESWDYLGEVVTDALSLPWLMVDGTAIFFGYADGKLNADLAPIEAARQRVSAAMSAAAESTGGFLERVREETETIDWRDIDSNEKSLDKTGKEVATWQLSECELAAACLEVWFSRQPDGAVRTIQTAISSTFDEETDKQTSRRCVEKSMRIFGGRPRKPGDPEGLHLERVEP